MKSRLDYAKFSPRGVQGLMAVHDYLATCGVDISLITMAFLRVSEINRCAYCIDMHTQELSRQGTAWEKIVLISAWREAGGVFDDRERATLAWAECLTEVAITGVSDDDYAAAAAVLSEKELADLSVAVALMAAFNRLGVAFRTQPVAASKLVRKT